MSNEPTTPPPPPRTDRQSAGSATREEVRFDSAGEFCEGWFFRPAGRGPHPCVVMAHGIGGVRGARLDAFAERFAAAGVAALVFDYRHHGTSGGEPRGLVDVVKQRQDYRAAIGWARQLHGVDADRMVVWGTSFSGGHALTMAAEDRRLAAAILQNPYVDGPTGVRKATRAAGAAAALALARAGARDTLHGLLGRPPHRIALFAAPGSVGLLTTADARAGFDSILPPEARGWVPEVPARVVFQLVRDRPARAAGSIGCPLLVCVCEQDRIAPVGAAVRVAQDAPFGELRRYPFEHFDVFTGTGFERVVTDQVVFLRQHLGLP